MKHGVWASDFHLGLQTDDIDRTEEIMEVITFIFKHAVKIKADFVVLGGDIFDNNTPSERLIALFISALNILQGIRVFVMVGNHDIIAGHKRRSCLSFIRKLAYPNLKLVDDIKTVRMWKQTEVGDVYFTFLPFMAKAHLKPAYRSVQQYVDVQAKKIQRKMHTDAQHYVFSHLMPPDCVAGSEQFMLKKVDLMVPKVFAQWKLLQCKPIIINGHVHTRQSIDNIHVVGSQVFTGFGEKEEKKYFLQLNIPEWLGEGPGGLEYIESPCHPFVELDVEIKPGVPITRNEEKFIKHQCRNITENAVLKINVTMDESEVGKWDFQRIRERFQEHVYYVKPIHPRILRKRVKRNKKQVVKLGPHDAVKEWLQTHKPKNPKRLLKLSDRYVERVL